MSLSTASNLSLVARIEHLPAELRTLILANLPLTNATFRTVEVAFPHLISARHFIKLTLESQAQLVGPLMASHEAEFSLRDCQTVIAREQVIVQTGLRAVGAALSLKRSSAPFRVSLKLLRMGLGILSYIQVLSSSIVSERSHFMHKLLAKCLPISVVLALRYTCLVVAYAQSRVHTAAVRQVPWLPQHGHKDTELYQLPAWFEDSKSPIGQRIQITREDAIGLSSRHVDLLSNFRPLALEAGLLFGSSSGAIPRVFEADAWDEFCAIDPLALQTTWLPTLEGKRRLSMPETQWQKELKLPIHNLLWVIESRVENLPWPIEVRSRFRLLNQDMRPKSQADICEVIAHLGSPDTVDSIVSRCDLSDIGNTVRQQAGQMRSGLGDQDLHNVDIWDSKVNGSVEDWLKQ